MRKELTWNISTTSRRQWSSNDAASKRIRPTDQKNMTNDKKIELVSVLLDDFGRQARQKSTGETLDIEWLNSLQETSTLKLILRLSTETDFLLLRSF
jgi:hypothetical protein